MTEPQLVDTSNPHLAQTPATLTTGSVRTEQGQLAVFTIRTPSATLTVFLGQQDADTWAKAFRKQADSLSGLAVASPSGLVTPR